MVTKAYVPDRGDFVWLAFDPQREHAQRGRRPALVLSPRAYNARAGLAVCCPVTSQVKGYPVEVAVDGRKIQGVVLSDQVKSLDWRAREASFIEKISQAALRDVQRRLVALLEQ